MQVKTLNVEILDQHFDFLSYLCEGKMLNNTDFNKYVFKPLTPTLCELD